MRLLPLPASALERPLLTAFGVAVALHATLFLAVGFKFTPPAIPASTIEVTLAQHRSSSTPDNSSYIAQHNQEGSGTEDKQKEITTDRIAPLASPELRDTDVPIASQTFDSQRPSTQQQIIATRGEQANATEHGVDEDSRERLETPPQNVREIASLRAKLSHQRQVYSKMPRTLVLTTVSARQADEAEYLRQWIEWVEKIGNEHYPEEARRKNIFGAMRLAVSLERDGNVVGIEILQSSGQRVLDQAAVRIVRLAAPFMPFPEAIRADRIEVIRTWNFVPGNLFNTSSQ